MSSRVFASIALAALLLVPAATLAAPAPRADPRVAPDLAAFVAAAPERATVALVTLDAPVTPSSATALQAHGVRVLQVFRDFGVVYVAGEGRDVLALAQLPGVLRVSADDKISFFDTGPVATNARAAWDARSTSTTPATVGGVTIDGAGVGVAVVDSGIDGTHPDLASAMGENHKWVCASSTPFASLNEGSSGFGKCFAAYDLNGIANGFDNTCNDQAWIAVDDSDTSSGHGTHVAGIVAGRGTQSAGRHMGAAPGATLFGLGSGDGDSIFWALQAFQWVHCHHATTTPPIRVVTNSWGPIGGSAFSPADPISVATNTLVADGIVVLFAAGNDGGTGTANVINGYAKNPTRGVISVANYDDQDKGTRSGVLASSSSRGLSTETPGENWPDVAAPGTAIMSTRAKTGPVIAAVGSPVSGGGRYTCCDNTHNQDEIDYVGASGTSMATPHVAGIVALLLEAKPTLTPSAVEDILEDAATAFTTGTVADPTNPTTSTHFGAGHGLVDAIAALQDARVGATGGNTLARIGSDARIWSAFTFDPESYVHPSHTVPAGRTVSVEEGDMVSGGTALAVGTAVRFVIDGVPTATTVVADNTFHNLVNGGAGEFRATVSHTFASGAHTVEVQIDDSGTWRAFDAFDLTAV